MKIFYQFDKIAVLVQKLLYIALYPYFFIAQSVQFINKIKEDLC